MEIIQSFETNTLSRVRVACSLQNFQVTGPKNGSNTPPLERTFWDRVLANCGLLWKVQAFKLNLGEQDLVEVTDSAIPKCSSQLCHQMFL